MSRQKNPVKISGKKAIRRSMYYAKSGTGEERDDNSASEAAEGTYRAVSDAYDFAVQKTKASVSKRENKYQAFTVENGESPAVRKDISKFTDDRPEFSPSLPKNKENPGKQAQKKRIKKDYARGRRRLNGKNTEKAAEKTEEAVAIAAKRIAEFARKHKAAFAIICITLITVIVVAGAFSSCGAMMSNGMGTVLTGSYMSIPKDIDDTDLVLSELEADLQEEIDSIETDYPGYDEYRYDLDPIGHDPFVLISYLSAVYADFTAASVQAVTEGLFDEMYELTLTPVEETRTRTVTKTGTRPVTDPVTGIAGEEEYEYEAEEEYIVTILEVTLTAKDLAGIVGGYMNDEQKEIFAIYNQTHGLTQQFYTPLDLYWYNYVRSYYGYRIDPVTGARELHKGLDIAVPVGTAVYASMDGIVTAASYDSHYGNYVVIEDDKGYCTKYAHLSSISVAVGQSIVHGLPIGATGNTGTSMGSELHIECLYNGEYYNPLFYFEAGEGTLYGEGHAPGSGGGIVPPGAYDDATVSALMAEAAKYLGYPYVWGGSNPSTSFDCSGFVCWVFSNSGVHDTGRTSAQGIYDQCGRVSASDAKPGDVIFFTGTYNSGTPVRSIASVIGANAKKQGYIEGNGCIVTWCLGHLVEVAPPEVYSEKWRKWSYESLPIIPDRWLTGVKKDSAAQYDVIRKLMHRDDVESVVCATDAGREGELIFRLVYEQAGCKKPIKRLWISSLEEKAIKEGLTHLKDGLEYEHLYEAALCRQRADWLVGINATRLFTVLYGGKVLKVGRVQTPTLAMLVEREESIRTFKKKPYYIAHLIAGGVDAVTKSSEKREDAEKIADACKGKQAAVISSSKEKKNVKPPKLYDLTTLQREASRMFSFTAKQTLEYTQSLYEKKLVTYPRTDSRYLSDDMGDTAMDVIRAIFRSGLFDPAGYEPSVAGILDSSKVTDHHALIPTVEIEKADLSAIPDGEKKILAMIAVRLLCATGRAYEYETARAELSCEGYEFSVVGRTITDEGWKIYENALRQMYKPDKDEDAEEEKVLPELSEGMTFDDADSDVSEHFTQPPKHFTEDLFSKSEVWIPRRKGAG